MKKLLTLILLVGVSLAATGKTVKIDKLRYKLNTDNTATLVKQDILYGDVVIPEKIMYDGVTYVVTEIGKDAFNYGGTISRKVVTSITLPNGLKRIGDNAFFSTNITSITIPKSVTYIGTLRILKTIIETIVVEPGNPNYDSRNNCNAIIETASNTLILGCKNTIIPNDILHIGTWAFFECYGLTSITLPNGLQSIGECAFFRCAELTNATVPDNCALGSDCFSMCTKLSLSVPYYANTGYNYTYLTRSVTRRPPTQNSQANNPELLQQLLAQQQQLLNQQSNQQSSTPQPAASQPTQPLDPIDTQIPVNASTNSRTFAVIIGNENYKKVTNVDYAINDAEIFAKYCTQTLGIPSKQIRKYTDVTYGDMLTALQDIKAIAQVYKGQINIIFYYAGHGVPNESSKDAFLLPVDADGTVTEVCMPVSRLYSELGSMNVNQVVVFMDACFSGAQRGEGMLAAARGVAIKSKPAAPQGNMVVFSAAQGDETAYPDKDTNHGLFTYYLLKGLQETKGDMTLHDLGEYITTNVSQQSIVVNRKSQTPSVSSASGLGNSWQSWKLK